MATVDRSEPASTDLSGAVEPRRGQLRGDSRR